MHSPSLRIHVSQYMPDIVFILYRSLVIVSNLVGGLRRIYLPQELVSRFLTVASENTARNLETCGILTGKLVSIHIHMFTHIFVVYCWFAVSMF